MVYPSFYNGPVNYYARLIKERSVTIEQYDHYSKQTYRNRCKIAGANEICTLSIPVKRERGIKNLVRDIRIDYDTPWQKNHWKSIESAYASSPFFEFICDDLISCYEKRFKYLIELNLNLTELSLKLIGIQIPVVFSSSFTEIVSVDDPRAIIHPKLDIGTHDPTFNPVTYYQVFSERHGFQSNLSILDLLFNEGPGTLDILKKSFR